MFYMALICKGAFHLQTDGVQGVSPSGTSAKLGNCALCSNAPGAKLQGMRPERGEEAGSFIIFSLLLPGLSKRGDYPEVNFKRFFL